MPRYSQLHRPVNDKNPLQGLLDYEGVTEAAEKAGGALGELMRALRDILDVNDDGEVNFDDLKDLLSGRPLIDAIMQGLGYEGSGFTIGDLIEAFLNLPMHVYNAIKKFITSVFDLGNLRITPNMISSGDSDNLLLAAGFASENTIITGEGWSWDGSVGRTALGSAKATANGTRLVQLSNRVRVDPGAKLPVSAWVKWAGVSSGSGAGISVEAQFYSGDAPQGAVVVGTIPSPTGSGGWVERAGTVTVPAGVDGMRLRLAVEASVTAGAVWFDDAEVRKSGTMPQNLITGLPQALGDLVGRFLGLGNSIVGFLTGAGAPANATADDPIADWIDDALDFFTGRTNVTAETADGASGVGSNALTNTVSIQAQVQDLVTVQDAGWTARPLWASMDYTADATFPLYLMQRNTSHSHSWSGTATGSTGSGGGSVNISISGTTSTETAGGSSHSHSFSGSDFESIAHTHSVSASVSGSNSTASAEYGAYTFTSSQAYVGFIRCGSVQEKRLFSFRGYYTAAVGDLRLDIYRLTKDGTMTLLHTSTNLAGALTTSAQWIQYVIPASTPGITVQPGDILGIQFRITSGTMALQGIDSLLTDNPPGFLPRRVGMLRSGTITAPATMAESVWSAGAGFVPYIECGIDTGQASAPLSIADNFNGALSTQWLLTGEDPLDATSGTFGITDEGAELSGKTSWGRFNTQLRTDQAKVGFTTTSPNSNEQIVWFKGNSPSSHVGLSITASTATLYTVLGGTRTNRAQAAVDATGAAYEIRFDASTRVYTVWRNGTQITSWADSANVVPSGLGNRYGGIGLGSTRAGWFGLNSTKASPIDNWLLADQ